MTDIVKNAASVSLSAQVNAPDWIFIIYLLEMRPCCFPSVSSAPVLKLIDHHHISSCYLLIHKIQVQEKTASEFLILCYTQWTPTKTTTWRRKAETESHSCLAHLPQNSCAEEGDVQTTLSCKTAPLPHTHTRKHPNHITVKTINTVQVRAFNTSVHLHTHTHTVTHTVTLLFTKSHTVKEKQLRQAANGDFFVQFPFCQLKFHNVQLSLIPISSRWLLIFYQGESGWLRPAAGLEQTTGGSSSPGWVDPQNKILTVLVSPRASSQPLDTLPKYLIHLLVSKPFIRQLTLHTVIQLSLPAVWLCHGSLSPQKQPVLTAQRNPTGTMTACRTTPTPSSVHRLAK